MLLELERYIPNLEGATHIPKVNTYSIYSEIVMVSRRRAYMCQRGRIPYVLSDGGAVPTGVLETTFVPNWRGLRDTNVLIPHIHRVDQRETILAAAGTWRSPRGTPACVCECGGWTISRLWGGYHMDARTGEANDPRGPEEDHLLIS